MIISHKLSYFMIGGEGWEIWVSVLFVVYYSSNLAAFQSLGSLITNCWPETAKKGDPQLAIQQVLTNMQTNSTGIRSNFLQNFDGKKCQSQ